MIKHLYDLFAERYYHGGSIYIYSDLHFGDLDCYKMRFPFQFAAKDLSNKLKDAICEGTMPRELLGKPLTDEDIVKELDQMQIDNINKKCTKRDTLIILGDVGDIECVKRLKAGYKVLIMGNHDKGASNYKRVKKNVMVPNDKIIILDNGIRTTNEPDVYDVRLGILHSINKEDNTYHEDYGMVGTYDNKLFDEVYEGTLQIGPKLILSHEPVEYPYCLNIHGHVHNVNPLGAYTEGINCTSHYNCCAEQINYQPVCLKDIINCGGFKNIIDIHRKTIDKAIERKSKRSND